MKDKKTIITKMLDILAEANQLDEDIVDHHSLYKAYCYAANVLNYEDESEPGEFDIYRFTYNFGDQYFKLYHKQLKPILVAEGLNKDQLKKFLQETFVL